ncbi:MAG: glycoside hydrolase family 9 protein [Oscillospiraceae bacterium]|nr:glycoside hydrolase family 9 protein [Oscillospiraceae bacterium]
MLKRKLGKKLAAGVTALAMVASASAASMTTLTAFAGEMLGEGTFNEGAGLPWHVCENGTGSMAFAIDDGVYSILIKNPGGVSNGGEDRWDCQFRHRGLTITYGNTYRLTYSVYATNSGYMYAKMGDITNDDCEYWHNNGTPLSMEWLGEDATMEEVESALKSASSKGEEVKYYQGWDKWKQDQIPAKKWTTYAWEFKINKEDMQNLNGNFPDGKGTAEWTFHFGGDGQYTPSACFKEGTILKFDNLALIDMDGSSGDYEKPAEKEKVGIQLNQVGYYPNLNKVATLEVEEGDSAAKEFTVYNKSGKAVYTGKSSGYVKDAASWLGTQKLDFSSVTEEGEYYIECDGKKSLTFKIGTDLYGDLTRDAINYFYLNRSGVEIEGEYVANGGKNSSKDALARKAGHSPDKAYITDEWVFIYTKDPCGSEYSKTLDVTGGWYDAGDYGKYVVNGGVSMWTLANMYERTVFNGNEDKFADGSGLVNIPETGNGTPDILDELCWEADFFMKMQREDGMVYHKMHDYKWTALGVMPYAESDDEKLLAVQFPSRIIKPVTYAATLNTAAALAQLARLIKEYDSSAASKYEAAAIKAYDAAKSAFLKNYDSIYAKVSGDFEEDPMFAPLTHNKGGGPYGDTQVSDEFYWAACELYITTGESEYYDDLKEYPEAFEVVTELFGGENQGSFTSFTWGTLASLGTASLAMNQDVLTDAEAKMVVESFQVAGDAYIEAENESGYGTPYKGMDYEATVTRITGDTSADDTFVLKGGYEWGSNSMVVNNAIIMGLAYDVTGDVAYLNGVSTALDYIFGRNAMENSYVTGYGSEGYTSKNPHHRYWCHEMKNDWPSAPDGVLIGGPNSNMNDPMIQGAGYKIGELAPMLCYYDQVDAWSVNEITINWNSPLAWVASFMADEGDVEEEPTTKPTEPDTGDEPTEDEPGDVLYGDADCNGEVDILDVIVLNRNILGAGSLTKQGQKNADVNEDGKPGSDDALAILKYVVKVIDKLPV